MASPQAMVLQALRQLQSAAAAAAQFSKELAFEVRTEAREALRTGFGLPRTVSSVASLGCFAVAAAGTASLSFDLFKKVYGQRVCEGCNGWEALTCRKCAGRGTLGSTASLGTASLHCSSCSGTGVVQCGVCHGDAWKPTFTLDRVLDSPLPGWDAYRQCQPVTPPPEAQAVLALVEQYVATMPIPPRPDAWKAPVLEQDALVQLGSKSSRQVSLDEMRRRASVVEESVLDALWAEQWRQSQVSEIMSEFSHSMKARRRPPKKQPAPLAALPAAPLAPSAS